LFVQVHRHVIPVTASHSSSSRRRIDMHVHMVGNGSNGSRAWLRLSGWHHWLAGFMLRQLGFPKSTLSGDLEHIYSATLLEWIRGSSLDAVVLLAHEQVYNADGTPRPDLGSMFVPNDIVLELGRQHPEFLPGVSIHPARPDAIDELNRCAEQGAVLMKCLPNCQNIDFSDERYQPFWRRMADLGMPLLAHTGGEHTVPVINATLADPKLLRFPLECGVTAIAAHCGTSSGAFDKDYFDDWVAMLRQFPNLYGDISAMVSLNRCGHLRDCLESEISARILHGSDFPVPVFGHRLWVQGAFDSRTFRRIQNVKNPLERDWQFKEAMGFPADILTRASRILRL
jgi:hypothetical protein